MAAAHAPGPRCPSKSTQNYSKPSTKPKTKNARATRTARKISSRFARTVPFPTHERPTISNSRQDVLSPIPSAPITAREHRAVVLQREIQARRHAGPFWTGTMEQWAEIDTHSGGQVNAFDGGVVATYGRKRVRKPFTLPSLKKVKVCCELLRTQSFPLVFFSSDCES
ncbi:hypothetical protein BDY17DRAFT_21500 [Neohortaea acidophila]|uniref:Uncharacterized protein n=1 Tax=Neohortaea acidophila TaxID=245834 RepID=A0A6A6Q6N3_9PEZI|nr:uncharacterized protein BDY17DRAFT_21500 [Neohortaea acidophila]KAF2487942.1 hypothetical protein BDY17DRAFT_21500 [Neohortaea acidophila]